MFDVEETVANSGDDHDSGYFSNGKLSFSQKIEVDDEYFFQHLLDDVRNDTALVTPKKADVPPVTTAYTVVGRSAGDLKVLMAKHRPDLHSWPKSDDETTELAITSFSSPASNQSN